MPRFCGANDIMCSMEPEKFLQLLRKEKCSAIIRTNDQQTAADAMRAAVRGGFRILEFTLTIPGALELIRDFSRDTNLIVGAGTVLSKEDARKAVAAGARYLVCPVTEAEIIAEATALGLTIMSGGHTLAELWNAYKLGAPLQKLFPAPAGGPNYVRACLGPMPFLRIVPTNGVDLENAAAYLQAGSFAVGFVNSLFPPDVLQEQRWDQIEQLAVRLRSAVSA